MSYDADVKEYAGKGDDTRECEAMRKMFVGGLSRNTQEESFLQHFEQYGEVVDKVIITDPYTKESRGFGFVTYANSDSVENAFKARPHNVDAKELDVKRAMPREYNTAGAHAKTKKLFVGGFKGSDLTADELQAYIESRHPVEFGRMEKIDLMKDPEGKNKGFGFMECSDNDFADRLAISENSFKLKGKTLAIKKAEPREGQGGPPTRGGPRGGRGGPRGGSSRGGGGRGGYEGGYGGGRGGGGRGGGYSSSNQNYSTSYPSSYGGGGGGGGGYESYGSGGQTDRYSQAGSGGYSQGGYGGQAAGGYGQSQNSYGSGYSQNPGSYQSPGGYGQSRGGGGRGGGAPRGGSGGTRGASRYQPY